MVGLCRPQFVLFGSSIVQMSYSSEGWGAILADLYARGYRFRAFDNMPNEQLSVYGTAAATEDLDIRVKCLCDSVIDIVVRGYSGWNSRLALQVLDQVFPKDAAVQPSLVIVYFGGNDAMKPHPSGLGAHVPLSEYVENMKKIAVHLKSLSEKTQLIFLTCPPVNEAEIREYFGNALDDQERTNELCGIYAEALVELGRVLDVKVINLWTAIQQRDDWETACFLDGIHLSSEGSKIVAKEILKALKEADWEPSLYWMSMPAEFSEDSPYYTVGPDGKSTVNVSCVLSRLHKEWVNI